MREEENSLEDKCEMVAYFQIVDVGSQSLSAKLAGKVLFL